MPDLEPVKADDSDMRVDRYLRNAFPKLSLGAINRALRQRQVRLNNQRIKGDARVGTGDIVYVPQFFCEAANIPERPVDPPKIDEKVQEHLGEMLVAVHEKYIVLNKPQGLAVQGGGGVRWHLDRMLPTLAMMHDDEPDSLRIVHRLDKETSGLMLIARGRKSAAFLAKQFQQRRIRKFYLALCHRVPKIPAGRISAPLGKCSDYRYRPSGYAPKQAETDYLVLDKTLGLAASVLLSPITGRTHQLRAHLAHIEHPIIGDSLYVDDHDAPEKQAVAMGGMTLHAMGLQVPDISQDCYLQPPPDAFVRQAKELGLEVPSPKALQRVIDEAF